MATVAPSGQLTEQEKIVLQLSADLWNAYVALPEQHPSDRIDFCDAIHTIQRIIGWRPLTRSGQFDL